MRIYTREHLYDLGAIGRKGEDYNEVVILCLYLREGLDALAVEVVTAHEAVGGEEIGNFDAVFFKSFYKLICAVAHTVDDDGATLACERVPHIALAGILRHFKILIGHIFPFCIEKRARLC